MALRLLPSLSLAFTLQLRHDLLERPGPTDLYDVARPPSQHYLADCDDEATT